MKPEHLNKEESERYLSLLKKGDIHAMFDFGFSLGERCVLLRWQEEQKKFMEGFAYKPPTV